MHLNLDQQLDIRPQNLTLDFFTLLMNAENKKKGIFQLVSFTRKRQNVYSTKLSDGFFQVKVMMVNEAAAQIDNNELHPLFILQGELRNHGEGIVVAKQRMKYWQFSKLVGDVRPWRLKKENVNYKGSNFIVWESQQLEALHSTQSIIETGTTEQIQNHKSEFVRKKIAFQELMSSAKPEQSIRISHHHNDQRTTDQNEQPNQQTEDKAKPQIQMNPSSDLTQTQQMPVRQEEHCNQNTKESQPKRQLNDILQLLLSSDDEDSADQNKEPKQVQSQKQEFRKSMGEKKIDLKFIFDCLEEEENISVGNKQKQDNGPNLEVSQDDEDFLTWIDNKKRSKTCQIAKISQSEVKNNADQQSQNQQIINLNKQKYSHFINQTQCDPQQQQIQQNYDYLKFKQQNMISLSDIYHGLAINPSLNWWVKAVVICVGSHSKQDYINVILADQNQRYLILATFNNYSFSCEQLRERQVYKLTKGALKQLQSNGCHSSSSLLQFDCQNCAIQMTNSAISQSCSDGSNYCPIGQIYMIEEGAIINVIGIIKSYKFLKGKTANTQMITYEIADPFTKWTITLVQFEVQLCNQKIQINCPITAYAVQVNSFKGNKNIMVKPNSIVKLGWLPSTKQASQILSWIDCGNSITDIEIQLAGFVELGSLRDIQDCPQSRFHISNVTIMQFKSQYTYRACMKCMKKVEEGRCRSCGIIKPQNVIDKLFLRGAVGDKSSHMNVLWSQNLAVKLLCDGFIGMYRQWVLKTVDVWIERGSNNSMTVVKMLKVAPQQRIRQLLKSISKKMM